MSNAKHDAPMPKPLTAEHDSKGEDGGIHSEETVEGEASGRPVSQREAGIRKPRAAGTHPRFTPPPPD